MPPLSRDRLVLSGAGLLAAALLLVLLLSRVEPVGPSTTLVVLGWLGGAAQLVGAVLLGGGFVLREQARRAAPRLPAQGPQLDWYAP